MAAYKRIKTLENLRWSSKKVVALSNEKCFSTRGLFFSQEVATVVIFTGKILVFWIGVCLWKVVSYEVGNDNSKELVKKVKADSLELVEVLYHWAR